MITVFTPTYNRVQTLERLYRSLVEQTDNRFEWLVIDDGSTDGTEALISSFINEGLLKINYVKRENRGLSRTLIQGVELAQGDIFFRIDSDDFAPSNAIELIYADWGLVEADERVCGLVFLKEALKKGQEPFSPFREKTRTNFFDFHNIYGGKGDMAEVIRIDVLRKYMATTFGDEKFYPEGIIWNRISFDYDAIYIPKVVYKFEYISDGLTKNVRRNMRRNAIGFSCYYAEIFHHNVRLPFYVKSSISFWRIALVNGKGFMENFRSVPFFSSLVGLLPGVLLCIYDSMNN